MGFLEQFLGLGATGAPTPKKIAGQIEAMQRRHGDPAMRYAAIEALANWGTPEAVYGLLQRFAVTVASETSDDEEKAHVAKLLTEKIGAASIVAIEKYLRREESVSWPLRVLSNLVPPEDFRARVLRVLADFDTQFDQHPDRKVDILHVLAEHAEHPEVPDAALRFLEDTDDTVRIAAADLLVRSGRPQDIDALAACALDCRDRPRVEGHLLDVLVGRKIKLGPRQDEFVKLLPSGLSLTLDGVLVKADRAPQGPTRRA